MKIHATIAHLGVFTNDGRMIDPEGTYVVPEPIPITFLYNERIHTVGQLHNPFHLFGTGWDETWQVVLAGVLFDPQPGKGEAWLARASELARAGDVFPEVQLSDFETKTEGACTWFTAATFKKVHLGFNPAWKSVSITEIPD